jgi:molybdopterin-guanine dinucleotide biosynthesis protein A
MNGTAPGLAAFILAGGKSTRMGADKAFVALDGCTLLTRALAIAQTVSSDVRIVGDPAKFAHFAPVVEDVFRGCGPLGGIHAALRMSYAELNLILAVDLPFVSQALLEYLIRRARNSRSTVTVAKTIEGWQPLCAVYRREFADAAEQSLRQERYKIDTLFTAPQTQVIEENELSVAGFSTTMFRNLNTQEDLANAAERQRLEASS